MYLVQRYQNNNEFCRSFLANSKQFTLDLIRFLFFSGFHTGCWPHFLNLNQIRINNEGVYYFQGQEWYCQQQFLILILYFLHLHYTYQNRCSQNYYFYLICRRLKISLPVRSMNEVNLQKLTSSSDILELVVDF